MTAEAATITCESNFFDGAGCGEQTGAYNTATDTNTWVFTDEMGNPIYALKITGVGDPEVFDPFELDVSDRVIDQDTTLNLSTEFSGAVCIPMFDGDHCTIFDVFVVGEPSDIPFLFDYEMTMIWFTNSDPLSLPLAGTKRILKAQTNDFFNDALEDTFFNPEPNPDDPNDPALGGRGNSFSSYIGTVPEPGTLLLFGTAAAATMVRRRRHR